MERCNMLVVGAGIGGISVAARLAHAGRTVVILEQEETAPYHATDRSAALVNPLYVPNAEVAALAHASAQLFREVPGAFRPKAALHLFADDRLGECLEVFARSKAEGLAIEQIEREEVALRFPYLSTAPEHCGMALYVPPGTANTIDVKSLYGHFRKIFYGCGGRLHRNEPLTEAVYGGGGWTVTTPRRRLRADVIVNCAGAWADDVARRCDARRLSLVALRRTLLDLPLAQDAEVPLSGGPFVFWERDPEDLYCDFRDAGRVLLSPADEEAMPPCDAEPAAKEIVAAIERFEERTKLRLLEKEGFSRAGLRTFARDRRPVIGWAREVPGFFWSAAFGGFGIECGLAISGIACDMLLNQSRMRPLMDRYGIRKESFSPDRLGMAGVIR